jgi:hypothetical protein
VGAIEWQRRQSTSSSRKEPGTGMMTAECGLLQQDGVWLVRSFSLTDHMWTFMRVPRSRIASEKWLNERRAIPMFTVFELLWRMAGAGGW